jgi:hypothetical protein
MDNTPIFNCDNCFTEEYGAWSGLCVACRLNPKIRDAHHKRRRDEVLSSYSDADLELELKKRENTRQVVAKEYEEALDNRDRLKLELEVAERKLRELGVPDDPGPIPRSCV